jgi:PEP-CTERM motif
MKLSPVKKISICAAALGMAAGLHAQVQVGIDPSQAWVGYMNWSPAPGDAAGYGGTGGSSWGTADLDASFTGSTITITPNTSIYRDNTSDNMYWFNADGSSANIMDANFYVQDDSLAGQTVTFAGDTLSYSLVSSYTSVAFIKDFAPDYSSFTESTYSLSTVGDFSISLATVAGDHIQYGFETVGPAAPSSNVASLGSEQIAPVPEPSSLALMGMALGIPFYFWKKRKA